MLINEICGIEVEIQVALSFDPSLEALHVLFSVIFNTNSGVEIIGLAMHDSDDLLDILSDEGVEKLCNQIKRILKRNE